MVKYTILTIYTTEYTREEGLHFLRHYGWPTDIHAYFDSFPHRRLFDSVKHLRRDFKKWKLATRQKQKRVNAPTLKLKELNHEKLDKGRQVENFDEATYFTGQLEIKCSSGRHSVPSSFHEGLSVYVDFID